MKFSGRPDKRSASGNLTDIVQFSGRPDKRSASGNLTFVICLILPRFSRGSFQIVDKVRFVHVGCGVNALSDLHDRANSI